MTPATTWRGRIRATLSRLSFRAVVEPLAQPNYPGAARSYRTASMGSAVIGVNAALAGSAETLRARIRHLMRANGHFRRAMREAIARMIGTGITPQPGQFLDRERRRKLIALWTRWTDFADADGCTDFYGLQVDVALAEGLDGEVFVRLRSRREEDDLPVPLQLQVLEADHCPIEKNEDLPNGNVIRCGIEFDKIGRRVAYWLYRQHPHDTVGATARDLEPVRVPAEQVLHIFEKVRPGQIRGEPPASCVLLTAYLLHQYRDFTLEKARCAAGMTGFIKVAPDSPGYGENGRPLGADGVEIGPDGAMDLKVEPGALINGNVGESIDWAPPSDVGDFAVITESFLRELAIGANASYSHTSGDYSKVNFSSLREEGIQLNRETEQKRFRVYNPQFNAKVWRAWFEAMIFDRRAAAFVGIRPAEYAADPYGVADVRWMSPRKEYANPQQEAEADRLLVRLGAMSLSSLIRERRGEDPETVFEEIAAERAFMASLNGGKGIMVEADPASVVDLVSRPSVGAPAEPEKPAKPAPARKAA